MLGLKNVSFTVHAGAKFEKKIINNISLELNEKDFLIILGGNGMGKSTLFKLISGALPPTSGEIFIGNLNVTKDLNRAYDVASVLQDPRLGTISGMSVFENMIFALKRGKKRTLEFAYAQKKRKFFQEQLSVLGMGLENKLDQSVDVLSGGQRQALSLMMQLLHKTKILLLDELTAALDPKTSKIIMELTNKMIQQFGITALMITHNMNYALNYGNKLCVIEEGKIIKFFNENEKNKVTFSDMNTFF